jgi:tetratricopeptide (TPR) repeat protein
MQSFGASIRANPENSFAYYNRGNVYFDLLMFQKADDDYSKTIELQSDMTPAILNRGMVRERLGNRAASAADYRAALALEPMLSAAAAGLKRLEESL